MTTAVLGVVVPCPCCQGDRVVEFDSLIYPEQPREVFGCPVCKGTGQVVQVPA